MRELQSITQEIVEEGITVLLVEQNLDFCLTLAQRHYLMDQGKIVYHGTNEEFMLLGSDLNIEISLRLSAFVRIFFSSPFMGEGVKKLKFSPSPYPLPAGERVTLLK